MRPNSFRISSDDVETFVGCSWSGEGAGQGWYEARDDGCTGVQGELQFQQAASHDRVVGTGNQWISRVLRVTSSQPLGTHCSIQVGVSPCDRRNLFSSTISEEA